MTINKITHSIGHLPGVMKFLSTPAQIAIHSLLKVVALTVLQTGASNELHAQGIVGMGDGGNGDRDRGGGDGGLLQWSSKTNVNGLHLNLIKQAEHLTFWGIRLGQSLQSHRSMLRMRLNN
jgi:hypothetical protein